MKKYMFCIKCGSIMSLLYSDTDSCIYHCPDCNNKENVKNE